MRQVINKLIREEDLYSAVDAAYSQRLAPREALLPHRPAHRDRRGHPRHRELARNCVEIGKKHTQEARRSRCRSAASCPSRTRRSSGSARTRSRSCAARSTSCATTPAQATACSVKWHDPRPPRSRASRAAATAASARSSSGLARRRHVPGVERELRPRPCGTRPWPTDGLDPDWYVHRHRTEDEVLPWDHLSAGLHKDFLWQDWQAALAERRPPRLPLDPLLRLRGLHRLLDRARRGLGHPARRRHAGHRPGPQPQLGPGRPAAPASRRRPERRPSGEGAPPLPQARQGPLHQPPRHRPRCWERALRRAELPVASTEGFSPRPKMHFGLALSTGHESLGEYLDVDLTDPEGAEVDLEALPERLSRCSRPASTWKPSSSSTAPRPPSRRR